MLKLPMQIYFDPDVAQFFREYAKKNEISFAQVIREAALEKKKKLEKTGGKMKLFPKKMKEPYKSLFANIKKIEEGFKDAPYYHPKLSDDKLMYG